MDVALYMVATPIGNMDDITYRAVRTLGEVDVIACEDTRHTSLLLNHYDIHKRLIACHSYNEDASAKGVVQLLEGGQSVAYVSDAGTPGVSDPGARLAGAVRKAGFPVIPIPGASASVTLVSAAGFVGKSFTFEGFLSPKPGRRKERLESLLSRDEAFIIYESPFRVVKTLKEIAALAPQRQIVAGREMTKLHEEYLTGTAGEVAATLEGRQAVKGEFAILVRPEEADDHAEET
ncbi:MAG: 16S rRNA (cytidine(1402)-2'-O)-methyltransferase [Sphaerochaetaceae bacterium]|nr:16S rRNA (cytidine(1402)-2'-O)-methyltransferase [Sphaerochaetaceae bacterium]